MIDGKPTRDMSPMTGPSLAPWRRFQSLGDHHPRQRVRSSRHRSGREAPTGAAVRRRWSEAWRGFSFDVLDSSVQERSAPRSTSWRRAMSLAPSSICAVSRTAIQTAVKAARLL